MIAASFAVAGVAIAVLVVVLLDRLKQTMSNVVFLLLVQKTPPVPGRDSDD
jgi:hypothetical protein